MASLSSDAARSRCPSFAACTPCTILPTACGFAGGSASVAGPFGALALLAPHATRERENRERRRERRILGFLFVPLAPSLLPSLFISSPEAGASRRRRGWGRR